MNDIEKEALNRLLQECMDNYKKTDDEQYLHMINYLTK